MKIILKKEKRSKVRVKCPSCGFSTEKVYEFSGGYNTIAFNCPECSTKTEYSFRIEEEEEEKKLRLPRVK